MLVTAHAQGGLSFVMRTTVCKKRTLKTDTHTLGPAVLRSIEVSDSHMHHWVALCEPISKWLLFLLQLKKGAGQKQMTEKGKNMLNV